MDDPQGAGAPLHGRDSERAAVRRVLDEALAGRGRALLVRGEAGIGKSALLADARRHAEAPGSGLTVLRCVGVESEVTLGFGGLQQLLAPVLDRAAGLPAAQTAALHGALGLAAHRTTDLLVCTATLALIERAARERPLLLLVDDFQWLDPATQTAVLFTARRLTTLRTGVAALIAVRDEDGSVRDAEGFPRDEAGSVRDEGGPAGGGGVGDGVGSGLGGGGLVRDLPTLRLRGLSVEAVGALLADRGRGSGGPDPAALHAATGGNPLALLEFSAPHGARSPADPGPGSGPGGEPLVDGAPLPAGPPLGARLRAAFTGRVRRLPAPARTLLLVAAADERGRTDVVLGAAARLRVPAGALDVAERAGLLHVSGPELRFRHPLVRSAVYADAPFLERGAAHLALAEEWEERAARPTVAPAPHPTTPTPSTAPGATPGPLAAPGAGHIAVWHRALASTGPDEEVAAALEQGAGELAERGGLAAVAAALSRAADLSESPQGRLRRLAEAAHAAWKSGRTEAARELSARAATSHALPADASRAGAAGPHGAAHPAPPVALARLSGLLAHASGPQDAAYEELSRGADALVTHSAPHAAALLFMACDAAEHAGLDAPARAAALRIAGLDGAPRYQRYGQWLAASLAGDTEATGIDPWEILRRAPEELGTSSVHRWLWPLAITRDGPHPRQVREFATQACAALRASGTLALLALPLVWSAGLAYELGLTEEGVEHATEAVRLSRDADQPVRRADALAVLARFAALRGDEDACHAHARAATALALPSRNRAAAAEARWALAQAALARGGYAEAREHLSDVHRPGSPYAHPRIARRSSADLVEAYRATGEPAGARRVAAPFVAWAETSGMPWAWADADRCRLLAPDPAEPATGDAGSGPRSRSRSRSQSQSQSQSREAYEGPAAKARADTGDASRSPGASDAAGGQPFVRARCALTYGEHLRRTRRPSEARAALREAADLFDGLGAVVWRDRALGQLRAAGGSARRRADDAPDRLTEQERQVARLAARGLTNREIAARLTVSPRTVGYHLYKIFPKLGVTSRTELRELPALDQ
ncbi:helix-turn-helix transcriptional regulator [Streptomyces buecherae]|uniref:helix-turn-helix transcriptional regulator n=1 Tax=Streptomyces buecherae TaxID=2763006 RepID=UPI0037A2ED6A